MKVKLQSRYPKMRIGSPLLIARHIRAKPQRWRSRINSKESMGESRCARDPLGAPGRSLEWIGEILCLVRHFSVSELHDTHGKDTFAAVVNHVLANPEVTFSHDPPDGKLGWLIRVVATQRLQISATVNYLA